MHRYVRNALLISVLFSASWLGGRRLGIYLGNRSPVKIAPFVGAASGPEPAARCQDLPGPSKMPCYRALLAHKIATAGIDKALDTLRVIVAVDSDVARDTHVYAHGIGIDAFQQHPDLGAIFSHCTPAFASGCYHGVMQAYFESQKTIDSGVVRATCRPYEAMPGTKWLLFQCLHGMGHGLDMTFDHELPRALEGCDMLEDDWHQRACYGGAFMENITEVETPHDMAGMLAAEHDKMRMGSDSAMTHSNRGKATPHHWVAYKRRDYQYPCSVVAERYKGECYGMQTALTLFLDHGSFERSARACDRAPTRFRAFCYESLGRDVAGYSRWEAPRAIQLCAPSARAYRASCYVGAAETFVNEATKPDPGFELCRAVTVAGDRAKCFKAVAQEIITLITDPRERERMCAVNGGAEADRRACRDGALLNGPESSSDSTAKTKTVAAAPHASG